MRSVSLCRILNVIRLCMARLFNELKGKNMT